MTPRVIISFVLRKTLPLLNIHINNVYTKVYNYFNHACFTLCSHTYSYIFPYMSIHVYVFETLIKPSSELKTHRCIRRFLVK